MENLSMEQSKEIPMTHPEYFELFIAMQNDFCYGDLIEQTILGVYDSEEKANERCSEVAQTIEYDPAFRTIFEIITTQLNESTLNATTSPHQTL